MGEFPLGTEQNPQNNVGGSADYWEGVRDAVARNNAEIAELRVSQKTAALGVGAVALANA